MRDNLVTPTKYRKKRKTTKTNLDDFDLSAIKRHVYGYFTTGKYPTLDKLKKSLDEAGLFHASRSSLVQILHNLGFYFKKIDKRKLLMEKPEISASRARFIREIMKENPDELVFLDETWVNANHCLSRGWNDGSALCQMKTPIGKGERIIVTHAGTSTGFVSNALDAFKSKKTGDYHEEMDSDHFKSK